MNHYKPKFNINNNLVLKLQTSRSPTCGSTQETLMIAAACGNNWALRNKAWPLSCDLYMCWALHRAVGRSESKQFDSNQRPIEGAGFSFQDLGGRGGGDCPPPLPPSPNSTALMLCICSLKFPLLNNAWKRIVRPVWLSHKKSNIFSFPLYYTVILVTIPTL